MGKVNIYGATYQQIRILLMDGPATIEDVVDEIGGDSRLISSRMSRLILHGHVQHAGKGMTRDKTAHKRTRLFQYQLTAQGLARTKKVGIPPPSNEEGE